MYSFRRREKKELKVGYLKESERREQNVSNVEQV